MRVEGARKNDFDKTFEKFRSYSAILVVLLGIAGANEARAAITWIQSLFRDEADRHILHELRAALDLVQAKSPNSDEFHLLMKTYSNLVKRWADV